MTPHITAKFSDLRMPSRFARFCRTWSSVVPSRIPRAEPSPPRRLHPPSTAAAMPYSSKKLPCDDGEIEIRVEREDDRRNPGEDTEDNVGADDDAVRMDPGIPRGDFVSAGGEQVPAVDR